MGLDTWTPGSLPLAPESHPRFGKSTIHQLGTTSISMNVGGSGIEAGRLLFSMGVCDLVLFPWDLSYLDMREPFSQIMDELSVTLQCDILRVVRPLDFIHFSLRITVHQQPLHWTTSLQIGGRRLAPHIRSAWLLVTGKAILTACFRVTPSGLERMTPILLARRAIDPECPARPWVPSLGLLRGYAIGDEVG